MRWSRVAPLLVVVLLSSPPPTMACTCVPPGDVYQEYTKSDAVFLGEVIGVESAELTQRFSSWVIFRVDQQWKGELGGEVRILNSLSSAACGADLRVGSSYLVYANDVSSSPGDLGTSLCTRTHAAGSEDPDVTLLNGAWPPPTSLSLSAVPNPSRGSTLLKWTVPATGTPSRDVRLDVVDFQGRRVRSLVSNPAASPGAHETVWDGRYDDGRPVPAGIYFVWLRTSGQTMSRKLVKVVNGP